MVIDANTHAFQWQGENEIAIAVATFGTAGCVAAAGWRILPNVRRTDLPPGGAAWHSRSRFSAPSRWFGKVFRH